jgi:predicted metal-binding protein
MKYMYVVMTPLATQNLNCNPTCNTYGAQSQCNPMVIELTEQFRCKYPSM